MEDIVVAGGGKVVLPDVVVDLVGKAQGDFAGGVGRAGVHDYNFVENSACRLKAPPQPLLLVFDYHAQ